MKRLEGNLGISGSLERSMSGSELVKTAAGIVLAACDVISLRIDYLSDSKDYWECRARHDGLTGLMNRAAFVEELDKTLDSENVDVGDYGVLFIDLTDFKRVNDNMGHEAGDDVLKRFANILRCTVRSGNNTEPSVDKLSYLGLNRSIGAMGRMGGDEFALLLNLTPRDVSDSLPSAEQWICQQMTGLALSKLDL